MKSHFNHFIKHLAHGFALLFIFILLLRFFNLIPGYWGNKTIYLFFISLISGTIFLGWEISEDKNTIKEDSPLVLLVSSLFIIFLTLVVLNEFFVISFLRNFKLELVSVSIALGALTFYANHNGVMDKFQKENDDESELENERKRDFSNNFPTLSKIPILRIFFKWMYKEGWIYSVGLILILVVAFSLRIYNVGKLGLTVDESWAYTAGESLIKEGSFMFRGAFSYYRGWTYSILVALSFFFFGISEFSLRLPGVILGTLTIIPLYLLTKEFTNKKLALIASIFLALFTWHIFYSRWARHYILASFFMVYSIYYTYLFFKTSRKKYSVYSILTTGLVVITVKELILLPLFYIGVFILYRNLKIKLKDISLIFSYLVPCGITLLIPEKSIIVATQIGVQPEPLLYKAFAWILNWANYQDYKLYFIDIIYNSYPTLLVFILIFTFLAISKIDKVKSPIIAPLFIFILMNIIGRGKTWSIRQMSFLFPIFIFYLVICLAFLSKKRLLVGLIIFLTIVNSFNLYALYSINYGTPVKGSIFELTSAENTYPDYKNPANFVLDNIQEGDVVISDPSLSRTYLPTNLSLFSLNDFDEDRDILMISEITVNHDRVWFINSIINDERFHFKNRKGKVRQFLENNEERIVFIGKDNISKVYLFEKNANW